MFTIAIQHISSEVQLKSTLLYHPLAVEADSLPDSKLVLAEHGRGFPCRNCGGGDRGGVAIYRPFGEFRRAKIALSPVWCSRPTTGVPLAHATMDFVGLDLTTSDRWHQKTTTRSVLTYECETLSMSRTDENMVSIYERKILRSILGEFRKMDHGEEDQI
ncbi:hypothetical protein TNCV_5031251 [Trichonephila clavipes]|nr:hypothetical protein TNCV_5031251 [Trichonephila clavipes]